MNAGPWPLRGVPVPVLKASVEGLDWEFPNKASETRGGVSRMTGRPVGGKERKQTESLVGG